MIDHVVHAALFCGLDATVTIAEGDGCAESTVVIPLIVAGRFRGIAEFTWTERSELVFGL